MSEDDRYQPSPSPGEVGNRFRRPLTQEELDRITAAARRSGPHGGLDGAFRETWDILLGEAEGMTMAEAVAQGLRFHPSEYAIPQAQAEELLGIWRRHRGRRYLRATAAHMLWLNMGPGIYPDE